MLKYLCRHLRYVKSDGVVTLDLAFVNFILFSNLDNGVMKSPKHLEIVSLVFTCLWINYYVLFLLSLIYLIYIFIKFNLFPQ